jgi:hypothetical protein
MCGWPSKTTFWNCRSARRGSPAGHHVPAYRRPPPSPPTISVSKYSAFIALRDALPRKYLKGHIVACRNKTTNGLEAGVRFRGPGVRGTALPASLKAYGNSVRREGEIICKMAARSSWGEFGVKLALSRTDPARPGASSCRLRSGVSPVPKSKGPGAPSAWFLGRRDRGHPPGHHVPTFRVHSGPSPLPPHYFCKQISCFHCFTRCVAA